MTKTFNFYTKNNSNNSSNFRTNKSTNYSTILDNIITADIIDKNKYLFDNDHDEIFDKLIDDNPIILTGSALKAGDDFTKAATFLANYKKYNKMYKLPYIIGKSYALADGTPIIFYDDEVQIGFDCYKYSNFCNLSFLKGLAANTKKTITNIYIFGASKININLL